jgi:hypothetical protein
VETIEVPLQQGRAFSERDRAASSGVVIITRVLSVEHFDPVMMPGSAANQESSMKRLIAMMCVATACTAAAVTAQSASTMDKDNKMKDHDKMAKGTVMVTGCVGDKDSMGHYMLKNATMSSMPDTTSGSSAPMSYMLSGGDLKPHVGHKVEVTGMMEKAKPMKMDKGDKKMDDKMAMSDTLKVKSVKMLAASCM